MLTILIHYLLLLFYLSLWKCITIHEPPWSTHSVFCLRLKYILAHCEVLVWSKNWVKKNKMLHSVIMCECNKLGMFFFPFGEGCLTFCLWFVSQPPCVLVLKIATLSYHIRCHRKGVCLNRSPPHFCTPRSDTSRGSLLTDNVEICFFFIFF